MVRILVVGLLLIGGLLTAVAPAPAEDGGQYYRGRNGMDLPQ